MAQKRPSFAKRLGELIGSSNPPRTAYQFIQGSGLPKQTVYSYLSGDKEPNFRQLVLLSRALGVSLSEFDDVDIKEHAHA